MEKFRIKLTLLFFAHYCAAFALFMLYKFFSPPPSFFLLDEFKFSHSLCSKLLDFCELIPVLQISGFLVVFAWFFPRMEESKLLSETGKVLALLRRVLLIAVGLSASAFFANEICSPLLAHKIASFKNLSYEYNSYLDSAKKYLAEGDFLNAECCAKNAARIKPDSSAAIQISKDVDSKIISEKRANSALQKEKSANFPSPFETKSAAECLQEAESMWRDGKFFEAHFFAQKAKSLFPKDSAESSECEQIAADAWKMMNRANIVVSNNSDKAFAEKTRGYEQFLAGNCLGAYRTFKKLEGETSLDPDVRYFLSLAEEEIKKSYFFEDEIDGLKTFEAIRDVRFSIKKGSGGLAVVSIKGVTALENINSAVSFLRGLNILEFDRQMKLTKNFSAPYAKLVMTAQNPNRKEKNFREDLAPEIIFVAIDRATGEVCLEPTYFAGEDDGSTTVSFPISFDKLNAISAAFEGPDAMSIPALAEFVAADQNFGYPREEYLQNLCERITFPLFLVLLTFVSAILAWEFQMKEHQLVKFKWVCYIPFFVGIAYFFWHISLYFWRISIYALINAFGDNAIFAAVALLGIPIIFAMLFFAHIASSRLPKNRRK